MTEAIAPPAERPVTNTRLRSIPNSAMAFSIIWRIDSASPLSRCVSSGRNHEKQFFGLFAGCCCG
jgi:hypothetical protein